KLLPARIRSATTQMSPVLASCHTASSAPGRFLRPRSPKNLWRRPTILNLRTYDLARPLWAGSSNGRAPRSSRGEWTIETSPAHSEHGSTLGAPAERTPQPLKLRTRTVVRAQEV